MDKKAARFCAGLMVEGTIVVEIFIVIVKLEEIFIVVKILHPGPEYPGKQSSQLGPVEFPEHMQTVRCPCTSQSP